MEWEDIIKIKHERSAEMEEFVDRNECFGPCFPDGYDDWDEV